MRLDELIAQLQDVREKHGNCLVFLRYYVDGQLKTRFAAHAAITVDGNAYIEESF